jgi:hypothetical protein
MKYYFPRLGTANGMFFLHEYVTSVLIKKLRVMILAVAKTSAQI